MSTFDPYPVGTSAMAATAAGLSLLVVGRATCGDEPLRRTLRRGLAVAEFVETVNDADRLLPRCHFDCIVVEVDSAADPVLAWVEGLQVTGAAPCICVAAPDDPSLASVSLRAGAVVVLPRPLDAKSLQRFLSTRPGLRPLQRGPAAGPERCACSWWATVHRSGACARSSSGSRPRRRRC
jgi:DNA-binding NtrC family response regulator